MVRKSHTESLPTLGALSSPVGLVVSSRPIALHVNCRPWGLLAIATILHHTITGLLSCGKAIDGMMLTEKFYLSLCSSSIVHLYRIWHTQHTHLFNSPLPGTTRVSWYQKGNTNLDVTEAREWVAVASAGHMQVCTSLQTDNNASTPPLSFLQARCQPTASKH